MVLPLVDYFYSKSQFNISMTQSYRHIVNLILTNQCREGRGVGIWSAMDVFKTLRRQDTSSIKTRLIKENRKVVVLIYSVGIFYLRAFLKLF